MKTQKTCIKIKNRFREPSGRSPKAAASLWGSGPAQFSRLVGSPCAKARHFDAVSIKLDFSQKLERYTWESNSRLHRNVRAVLVASTDKVR